MMTWILSSVAGYRFAADHPGIDTVLTGTANIQHLEKNVAAMEKPYLSEKDEEKLIKLFSHIAEYA